MSFKEMSERHASTEVGLGWMSAKEDAPAQNSNEDRACPGNGYTLRVRSRMGPTREITCGGFLGPHRNAVFYEDNVTKDIQCREQTKTEEFYSEWSWDDLKDGESFLFRYSPVKCEKVGVTGVLVCQEPSKFIFEFGNEHLTREKAYCIWCSHKLHRLSDFNQSYDNYLTQFTSVASYDVQQIEAESEVEAMEIEPKQFSIDTMVLYHISTMEVLSIQAQGRTKRRNQLTSKVSVFPSKNDFVNAKEQIVKYNIMVDGSSVTKKCKMKEVELNDGISYCSVVQTTLNILNDLGYLLPIETMGKSMMNYVAMFLKQSIHSRVFVSFDDFVFHCRKYNAGKSRKQEVKCYAYGPDYTRCLKNLVDNFQHFQLPPKLRKLLACIKSYDGADYVMTVPFLSWIKGNATIDSVFVKTKQHVEAQAGPFDQAGSWMSNLATTMGSALQQLFTVVKDSIGGLVDVFGCIMKPLKTYFKGWIDTITSYLCNQLVSFALRVLVNMIIAGVVIWALMRVFEKLSDVSMYLKSIIKLLWNHDINVDVPHSEVGIKENEIEAQGFVASAIGMSLLTSAVIGETVSVRSLLPSLQLFNAGKPFMENVCTCFKQLFYYCMFWWTKDPVWKYADFAVELSHELDDYAQFNEMYPTWKTDIVMQQKLKASIEDRYRTAMRLEVQFRGSGVSTPEMRSLSLDYFRQAKLDYFKVIQADPKFKERVQPVVLWLYGKPKQGKNESMRALSQAIYTRCVSQAMMIDGKTLPPYGEGAFWAMPNNSEYHDGYMRHFGVKYNEFCKELSSEKRAEEGTKFLMENDAEPCPCNYSEAHLKGTGFLVHRLSCVTTNFCGWHDTGMTDVGAMHRRQDFPFEVVRKKSFDMTKPPSVRDLDDAWEFKLVDYRIQESPHVHTAMGSKVTGADYTVSDFVIESVKKKKFSYKWSELVVAVSDMIMSREKAPKSLEMYTGAVDQLVYGSDGVFVPEVTLEDQFSILYRSVMEGSNERYKILLKKLEDDVEFLTVDEISDYARMIKGWRADFPVCASCIDDEANRCQLYFAKYREKDQPYIRKNCEQNRELYRACAETELTDDITKGKEPEDQCEANMLAMAVGFCAMTAATIATYMTANGVASAAVTKVEEVTSPRFDETIIDCFTEVGYPLRFKEICAMHSHGWIYPPRFSDLKTRWMNMDKLVIETRSEFEGFKALWVIAGRPGIVKQMLENYDVISEGKYYSPKSSILSKSYVGVMFMPPEWLCQAHDADDYFFYNIALDQGVVFSQSEKVMYDQFKLLGKVLCKGIVAIGSLALGFTIGKAIVEAIWNMEVEGESLGKGHKNAIPRSKARPIHKLPNSITTEISAQGDTGLYTRARKAVQLVRNIIVVGEQWSTPAVGLVCGFYLFINLHTYNFTGRPKHIIITDECGNNPKTPSLIESVKAFPGRDLVRLTLDRRTTKAYPNCKKNFRTRAMGPSPDTKVIRVIKEINGDKAEYMYFTGETLVHRTGADLKVNYDTPEGGRDSFQAKEYYIAKNCFGKKGHCAYPYLDMRAQTHYMLGFHFGANASDSFIVPIYQEDFEGDGDVGVFLPPVMESFVDAQSLTFNYVKTREDGATIFSSELCFPGVHNLGILNTCEFIPVDTQFEKSPLYDSLQARGLVEVAPAYLRNVELDDGTVVNPHSTYFGKRTLVPEITDTSFMEWSFKNSEKLWEGFVPEHEFGGMKPFTLEQILEGSGNLNSLTRTSSMTMDYRHRKEEVDGKKGRFVLYDIDEVTGKCTRVDPELRKDFDYMLANSDNPKLQFQGCNTLMFKDELLSLEKQYSPRGFCVASLLVSLFTMVFAGPILDRMKNHIVDSVSAVGINPMSYEWEKLCHRIFAQHNVMSSDFKWDLYVRYFWTWHFGTWLIHLWGCAEGSKLATQLRNVASTVVGSFIIFRTKLCSVQFEVSSGHILTTLFNTFANYCMHKGAFEFMKFSLPEVCIGNWKKDITAAMYGDDSNIGVSDRVAHWYNMKTLAAFFRHYCGMVYTTCSKGSVTKPFLDRKEVDFLSRSYRLVRYGVGEYVMCPLSRSSIYGMLAWIRKSSYNCSREQLEVNVKTACMEFFFHGPDAYESFVNDLHMCFQESQLSGIRIRSYEYWLKRYLTSYMDSSSKKLLENAYCPDGSVGYLRS